MEFIFPVEVKNTILTGLNFRGNEIYKNNIITFISLRDILFKFDNPQNHNHAKV